ncbi:hypothetical protein, partial [Cupriavidus sp. WS]|uniref:hypothetical protein n=1 Tax=Cupriavidus sp. WS TaxID=1312922 RepID=UPI0005B77F64
MVPPWRAALRAAPPADLRVAIDARTWTLGAGTGVATYARTLGDSLAHAGVPLDWLTGGVGPQPA